jgi:hypothetical protein
VALYDYDAQNELELSLKQGDIVAVIKRGTDGWWEGFQKDRFGLFPCNYVKPLDKK